MALTFIFSFPFIFLSTLDPFIFDVMLSELLQILLGMRWEELANLKKELVNHCM